ncbi:hypothetical protein [Neisseria sp. CCUG12390]|uniref:hypothetical protein n=1 Tax=Neisseria sp. CCUG12390 TaxID=3392035 RepID=UPI003A0FBAC6
MFLNQLSTSLKKACFLELAMLVMMASDENNASEKMVARNSDVILNKFLSSINIAEEAMLTEYQNELFANKGRSDGVGKFLEESLSPNCISFDEKLAAGRADWRGILFSSVDFVKHEFHKGHFPAFWYSLKQSINEVLNKYSDNTLVKQDVMQYLVEGGEDILTLTPEKIQASMASLPKIKQEILNTTVYAIVEPKKALGLKLSEREKKIFICELVGAGYSSGNFEAEEEQLIETVCTVLSIDHEYIEEFADVMQKLFKANKELADLVNE